MFGFFSKKRVEKLEDETKKGFHAVKEDLNNFTKWIKYLDRQDKQVLDIINELKADLSSIKDEVNGVKEAISLIDFALQGKQMFKKPTAVYEQAGVDVVEKSVQTPVQTANFHNILQGLSANERLITFTLINAGEEMKLSYEDLAKLLGKERSTIRGQINSIKQKSEGLIKEITEQNGKKRVFIPEEIKEKLLKYAKVRVNLGKKLKKGGKN